MAGSRKKGPVNSIAKLIEVIKKAEGVEWYLSDEALRARLDGFGDFCPITLAVYIQTGEFRFPSCWFYAASKIGFPKTLAKKVVYSVDLASDVKIKPENRSCFSQRIRNRFLQMAGLL